MKRLRRLSLLLGPLMVVFMLANIIAGISPVDAARSTGSSIGKATGVKTASACPTDASAITSMSVRITRGGNTINASNMSGVLPGDTVRVTFDLDDDCANYRVSLASYKAPDATNNLDSLPQRVLNSQQSNLFGSSGGSLTVNVPNCYHATILAVGSVLTTMSPAAVYGARQKDTKNGGSSACAGIGAPSPFYYVEGNQNCAYLGNLYGETWAEYKIDAIPTNGTRTIQSGYTITVSDSNNKNTFSWSSSGTPLRGVFVKASTGGNLYRYASGAFSGSNLKSVGKANGSMYDISHVSFCYAPIPTTVVCPTGKSAVTAYRFEIWRDGTKINATDLNNVQVGDLVKAYFDLAPGCSNIRLSLASYEAPDPYYDVNKVHLQVYMPYSGDTGLFSATQSSSQRMVQSLVPGCYFQIDFVYGEIIENLTPDNLYGSRKFAWKNGGNPACASRTAPTETSTPNATTTKQAEQTATKIAQQTGTSVAKTQTAIAPPTQTAVSKTQTAVAGTATSVAKTQTVVAQQTGTSVAKTATAGAQQTSTVVSMTQTMVAQQTATSVVKTATASANQTATTTAATGTSVAETATAAANETGTVVSGTATSVAATSTWAAGETETSVALTTTAQPGVTQTAIAELTQTAGPGATQTAHANETETSVAETATSVAITATHAADQTGTAVVVSQTSVALTATHVAGETETAVSITQTAVAETATHVAGVTETWEAGETETAEAGTATQIAIEESETAVAGVTQTFVAGETETAVSITETVIANETGTAEAATVTEEAVQTGTSIAATATEGAIQTQTATANMPGSLMIHKTTTNAQGTPVALYGACFDVFAPTDYDNAMVNVCDNDASDADDLEGTILLQNLTPTNGNGLGYMIVETFIGSGYIMDTEEKFVHVYANNNPQTGQVTIFNAIDTNDPPWTDVYLYKLVCDEEPTEVQLAAFVATLTIPENCQLGAQGTEFQFEILDENGELITTEIVGENGGPAIFAVDNQVPSIEVWETAMNNPLITSQVNQQVEFYGDIHCPCGASNIVVVNEWDDAAVATATAAAMPTNTPEP